MTADYFAASGVNWSTLKAMRDSPKAYLHATQNPVKPTWPMILGRAVHSLVFEPETFGLHYVVWEGGDRRGKKWDEFEAAHAHLTILKRDEKALALDIAAAVHADPEARDIITGGVHEAPIFWSDPATGINCKARPDTRNRARGILADLKTTRSVDARRFGNECARLCYPQQLGHYSNGCAHGDGWRPAHEFVIAVEKEPPHDVGVFEIPAANREIASDEVAALLARVRECRAANRWPGRYDSRQMLQLPAYIEGELEIEFV